MPKKNKRRKPPKHYDQGIQPWDVIKAWKLCFWLGNVVKYICRAGKKKNNSKLQDLLKARNYLDEAIRQTHERMARRKT